MFTINTDAFNNKNLNNIFNSFSVFYVKDENFDLNSNTSIKTNLSESDAIIIQETEKYNCFLICFKNTIILIKKYHLKVLQNPMFNILKLPIFFLTKESQNHFRDEVNIHDDQIKSYEYFINEVNSFQSYINNIVLTPTLSEFPEIEKYIISIISGYLIRESYAKLNDNQRNIYNKMIDNGLNNKSTANNDNKITEFEKNDFIELRLINSGNSEVYLNYIIKERELVVIKRFRENDKECPKLIKREIVNYSKIDFPLLPKLYGTIKEENSIVIQFINGQTLNDDETNKFNGEDKIFIILEMILIIEYLHKKHLVYRDLKPNNVMIDENKNIFLIDFDRMIDIDDIQNNENDHTLDIGSEFIAPEVKFGNIRYENDIYSLGKMITYIVKNSMEIEIIVLSYKSIFLKCVDNDFKNRPSIFKLKKEFIQLILQFGLMNENVRGDINKAIRYISLAANQNQREAQFKLSLIYLENGNIDKSIYYYSLLTNKSQQEAQFALGLIIYEGKYVTRDINKAIQYFSLAAKQNQREAQCYLGLIIYEGKYVTRDINKAIQYFSLAANQNQREAQYYLGVIFYGYKYINKAIHYFSLAANQNHPGAHYYLGLIYFSGQNITADINKAIHHLSFAADQNNSEAQFYLGTIYISNEFVTRDINKAIHYLTLAANQNHPSAQFTLGLIYYLNEFDTRDINKAIHYFSLAADQNHQEAHYYLGLIYYSGQYIAVDFDKALYHLSFAANQNNQEAQLKIGAIYYLRNYKKQDINKAIYYFSLAADQNNSEAQFLLGTIYYSNKFVTRDINKAIHYFSLAANQNHPNAQFNLGFIYYSNEFVTRDINKAIHYFSLAANHNHPGAQFGLGAIYLNDEIIPSDINKAIHYFQLAANQNYSEAQYKLGEIFFSGKYITQNIDKGIRYLSLAAKQNNPKAQCILGDFYSNNEFITPDIDKAIFYFSNAADQNYPIAQLHLSFIYLKGELITQDINKAIHYLSLAANGNNPIAQLYLGLYCIIGEYVTQDINKAIQYLSLAANQNQRDAQFILGFLHIRGVFIEKNMIKGIDFLIQSASNKKDEAHFLVGYFYHEGKYVTRDIKKAIQYYKDGSTFNDEYAKNNLGIIFKNGIDNELKSNIGLSMSYFDENIKRFNNEVSMYNMSHIYIYDDQTPERIDESIKLLIKSLNKNFDPSKSLLCIALIKKHGYDFQNIKKELQNHTNQSIELFNIICEIITDLDLQDEHKFESFYQQYKKIDFLYNFYHEVIESTSINEREIQTKSTTAKGITSDFYEGFGN